MARAPRTNRGLALRWPVPVGALAVGCGLAVLLYQAGAVPVPAGDGAHPVLGPLAPVHGTTSADSPQRSALRPVDVTQHLLVAVQLAPAAATSGLHVSAGVAHGAASHHALVLNGGGHTGPASLAVVADPPASGADPGIPALPPIDPGLPPDPGSILPPTDTGTLPDPGTVTGTTDPATTTTADPGTTTPADPGTTTPTDPGTTTTPPDPGTTTPTDPSTTTPPDPTTGVTLDTTGTTTTDTPAPPAA